VGGDVGEVLQLAAITGERAMPEFLDGVAECTSAKQIANLLRGAINFFADRLGAPGNVPVAGLLILAHDMTSTKLCGSTMR
jgi:hypothetical protein